MKSIPLPLSACIVRSLIMLLREHYLGNADSHPGETAFDKAAFDGLFP